MCGKCTCASPRPSRALSTPVSGVRDCQTMSERCVRTHKRAHTRYGGRDTLTGRRVSIDEIPTEKGRKSHEWCAPLLHAADGGKAVWGRREDTEGLRVDRSMF